MGTLHPLPHTRTPTVLFPTAADGRRSTSREKSTSSSAPATPPAGPPSSAWPPARTPVGLYRELIRLHKEEGLDFSRVVTFNLDEYFPMPPDDPHSYHRWMHETFFNHVNIPPAEHPHPRRHARRRRRSRTTAAATSRRSAAAGGIDLQILGIGRTGHIGFNEPGSTRNSRTRLVTLDPVTRRDAAGGFFGEENVPHQAITMGVGTILDARKIVLMAFGEHKAADRPQGRRAAADRRDRRQLPAAAPRRHVPPRRGRRRRADRRSSGRGCSARCDWTPALIRRAVIWLSLKVEQGPAEARPTTTSASTSCTNCSASTARPSGSARRVFDEMMATICTHPAGRRRPKTVLVFSPHPDDDVISMGGTLIRLVEQGHKVHIAYMTSGNIAVFDHDAWRFADFVVEFNRLFGIDREQTERGTSRSGCSSSCDAKKPGQPDTRGRAQDQGADPRDRGAGGGAGVRHPAGAAGVHGPAVLPHRHHRQGPDPPAGHRRHRRRCCERLQPAQIYVAGEMSDPHGTHRICAEAIFEAVRRGARHGASTSRSGSTAGRGRSGSRTRSRWRCRSARRTLERKKQAIFRHQSQKDRAMFPGGTRPPRVLAAGRGPQPRHRQDLRRARAAGVLRAGRVRAVEGRVIRAAGLRVVVSCLHAQVRVIVDHPPSPSRACNHNAHSVRPSATPG